MRGIEKTLNSQSRLSEYQKDQSTMNQSTISHDSNDTDHASTCVLCAQKRVKNAMRDFSISQMVKTHHIGNERYMHDRRLSRLLINFDKAKELQEVREFDSQEIVNGLVNDKIGRYYLIHDILFRCDEALNGKHESSPTKEYKYHVKATLDSFESKVRREATRRNLHRSSIFKTLNEESASEL